MNHAEIRKRAEETLANKRHLLPVLHDEFALAADVLVLLDEAARYREALERAPTPEHVGHDKVGARSYARWYDGLRRAAVGGDPE